LTLIDAKRRNGTVNEPASRIDRLYAAMKMPLIHFSRISIRSRYVMKTYCSRVLSNGGDRDSTAK